MTGEPEPWRVGIVGSEGIEDIAKFIYRRLKILRTDWPKATFEVVASCTGTAGRAAVSSARRLGMEFKGTLGSVALKSERMIVWVDFKNTHSDEATHQLVMAIARKMPSEVYDQDDEPAGARFGQ